MKITGQQPTVLQDVKGGHRRDFEQAQLREGGLQPESSVRAETFTLNKMKLRLEAEPEVRAEKVAELKAKLKSGEYEVDSQKLARNLLLEGLQEGIS